MKLSLLTSTLFILSAASHALPIQRTASNFTFAPKAPPTHAPNTTIHNTTHTIPLHHISSNYTTNNRTFHLPHNTTTTILPPAPFRDCLVENYTLALSLEATIAIAAMFALDPTCDRITNPFQFTGSFDPDRPHCVRRLLLNTATLSMCVVVAADNSVDAAFGKLARFTCEDADRAYSEIVSRCQVGGQVSGRMTYDWGWLEVFHSGGVVRSTAGIDMEILPPAVDSF